MKSLSRLSIFAAIASASVGALATENLHWRCWYDQQTHITCIVDMVPSGETAPLPNLPTNLPPIVQVMRKNPAAMRNRIIHIPLHTDTDDMVFTAQLARSMVCGSRRDCTVNFSPTLPPAEEIVALLNKNLPGDGLDNPAFAMAAGVLDDPE